jgi:hypothetical protein
MEKKIMTTAFRTPYGYFRDEMDSIPFEGPRMEIWKKDGVRKQRFLLFQFMIWSYLFIASALLALPFWIATGFDIFLGIPLLLGGVALVMFGIYRRTGDLL